MNLDLYAEMTVDLLMQFRGKPEIVALLPMEADMGAPIPVFCSGKIYWQIPFFISGSGNRVWLGIAVMDGISGELSSYWKMESGEPVQSECAKGDYLQGSVRDYIKTVLQDQDTLQDDSILPAYLERIAGRNQAYAAITPLCLKIRKVYRQENGK